MRLTSARETFSNWALNGKGRKVCVFQRKTGHILKTVRDTANVTISHL